MGPPRELLGRLPQRRREAPVLIQVQLLAEIRRVTMVRISRYAQLAWVAAASVAVGGIILSAQAPDPQTVVNNAFNEFKKLKEGKNADYIPALAKVDPNLFEVLELIEGVVDD